MSKTEDTSSAPIVNGIATRDIQPGEVIEIPLEELEVIIKQSDPFDAFVFMFRAFASGIDAP